MTSANDTRKLTDYPKVRGTSERKVAQGDLRELGMWVETAGRDRWGGQYDRVFLAGAGAVGRINKDRHAEVQEWAIEAGLKLDVATNVKLAAQAQVQTEAADKVTAAINAVGVC